MSSFELIGQKSNLIPHSPTNKMTLVAGHLKNKWAKDSIVKPQRAQLGSSMPILYMRFS